MKLIVSPKTNYRPWCVISIFNEIITLDDKMSGRPRSEGLMEEFRQALEKNNCLMNDGMV